MRGFSYSVPPGGDPNPGVHVSSPCISVSVVLSSRHHVGNITKSLLKRFVRKKCFGVAFESLFETYDSPKSLNSLSMRTHLVPAVNHKYSRINMAAGGGWQVVALHPALLPQTCPRLQARLVKVHHSERRYQATREEAHDSTPKNAFSGANLLT